ncbi:hypothetical protein LXL04_004408 [Taraxacum kok-saghyz]
MSSNLFLLPKPKKYRPQKSENLLHCDSSPSVLFCCRSFSTIGRCSLPVFSPATRQRLWCDFSSIATPIATSLVRFLPFKPPISPPVSPDFSTNTGTSFNSKYVDAVNAVNT